MLKTGVSSTQCKAMRVAFAINVAAINIVAADLPRFLIVTLPNFAERFGIRNNSSYGHNGRCRQRLAGNWWSISTRAYLS